VKLGLVGYGKIAPKHLEVFRALGANVIACVNRSEAGRERAKAEGKIEKTYARIDEMMAREKPDGVLVTASFPQIFEVAKAVIPHGRPVLLEKPPGTSMAELDALGALADRHQTPVMVAFNRRHYSVVERAIEDAGGPEAIHGVFVEWSEDPEHALKRFSEDEVARWIFANSLHGLDLCTHLAGAIPSPEVVAKSFGTPFRWMMALSGLSDRGALATFHSTWDAPGKWRVAFTAKDKRYVFQPLESCVVLEKGQSVERRIEPSPEDQRFKPGFFAQAKRFLEAVDGGRAHAAWSLRSAAPAMALAESLTKAFSGCAR
jgi:predicted dehydrogenase